MSKAEFLEKYGDVQVEFSSYYKYSFTFIGTAEDGAAVSVSVGGNADDIYRMEVVATYPETVRDLDAYSGDATLNGETVASFYDY
jgi:hypothetical protein